ncbi:MAG TPA: rhodanese-like domain-containing protein [Candidatus Binatia bacterium]|jgi:rhodanese-related sulfurtransferase|nr:rhodanese-like domain-containing protein [Candidatus Binatia bacterium]
MPTTIDRAEVRRLLTEGARLIEVLPAKEYEDEHLLGAINIPLATLDRQATATLLPHYPVIVYCYDSQ